LEITFPESQNANLETLESKIASILWRWKFTDPKARESVIAETKLRTIVEFWFPFSEICSTRKSGTSCDGIPLLKINSLNRTSFVIRGVGYFPDHFAAFEVEFHFENRRDTRPKTIVLRLGSAHSMTHSMNELPESIFNARPTTNKDWAVAVELTDKPSANDASP